MKISLKRIFLAGCGLAIAAVALDREFFEMQGLAVTNKHLVRRTRRC
ncbi:MULTISPECIES: hypothetical protein [Rhizobium/Agrobacterium group]|nr:hypothetical protein [Rhizobium rhizogenes]NSY62248.1 hypothetical protein [Agrobacterium tumefaciens]UXT84474.1 hypothetical protein FY131_23480 [Agrobacterium tumefaciens]